MILDEMMKLFADFASAANSLRPLAALEAVEITHIKSHDHLAELRALVSGPAGVIPFSA